MLQACLQQLLQFITTKVTGGLVERNGSSGVVVSALASINEVNLRRARLVLRWATVSGVQFPVSDTYFGM